MRKEIISKNRVSTCYFRSSVKPPNRKALIQITEKCNLHCAHCFISAGKSGSSMSLKSIEDTIIPTFLKAKVVSVTLTGGEPFTHPQIIEIVKQFSKANIRIGICTNATLITQDQIKALSKIGNIHFNISLDGFRSESHGKFRGDLSAFDKAIDNIRLLGEYKLLQGILVTPNNLAEPKEYAEICKFAVANGATYVLMNPLSSMGRGVKSENKLKSSNKIMEMVRKITQPYSHQIQIVYVRFPNNQKLSLGSCEAGNIIYVFTNGDIAICPYLVFAARTPQSQYDPKEFVVNNVFADSNSLVKRLEKYNFCDHYQIYDKTKCRDCKQNLKCGRGCPAAIISTGHKIGDLDELCPKI